eukprot:COSAG01_NODE_6314_length_3741_cov_18.754256_3_plen_138_part_00
MSRRFLSLKLRMETPPGQDASSPPEKRGSAAALTVTTANCTVRELRQHAQWAGIDDAAIDRARDAARPKEALVALIEAHGQGAPACRPAQSGHGEAAAAASAAALPTDVWGVPWACVHGESGESTAARARCMSAICG